MGSLADGPQVEGREGRGRSMFHPHWQQGADGSSLPRGGTSAVPWEDLGFLLAKKGGVVHPQ